MRAFFGTKKRGSTLDLALEVSRRYRIVSPSSASYHILQTEPNRLGLRIRREISRKKLVSPVPRKNLPPDKSIDRRRINFTGFTALTEFGRIDRKVFRAVTVFPEKRYCRAIGQIGSLSRTGEWRWWAYITPPPPLKIHI